MMVLMNLLILFLLMDEELSSSFKFKLSCDGFD